MRVDLSVLICVSIVSLIGSHCYASNDLVWTDRGCGSHYSIDEAVVIYFAPYNGVQFELWAYDAAMESLILAAGVGEGKTYYIEETIRPPAGPLTFVLKMPCSEDCEACMCDFGQCTVFVEEEDPCEDHCTNGIQDCGEYGRDCGGGCPFFDTDQDGIEDCRDVCPQSRCDRVDSTGCETDADSDSITDCEDDCPDRKGEVSNKGCPDVVNRSILLGSIGGVVLAGILGLWRMKGRKK